MKRRSILLALALPIAGLSGIAPSAIAAPATVAVDRADGQTVPGSYIVTVRAGSNPRAVASAAHANPKFVYTSALTGFAADLNQGQLVALQHHRDVVAIEEDQVVTATGTQNTTTYDLWGLDRSDQRNLPLSGTYTWTNSGSGVNVYVFDSGIRTTHIDFGGRATNIYDAFGGTGNDCNGHGTHVAGTIGGNILGIAKTASLKGVRVLDCSGNGTVAGIISAVDWVRVNHVKPAVANMSLGSGFSSSFNTAVNNLINAGVVTSVAAGNSRQNACNYSPSAVTAALVVAASDRNDTRANFSNHGSCVDLYAPGVDIWSAWHTADNVLAQVSGTSQASPHVAGVAAQYKGTFGDATSSTVHSWIVNNATNGVIQSNRTGTVNKLLFTNL